MIIVPTLTPLFPSNRSDSPTIASSVRYLQSNTTNTTTSNTTTSNTTTNTTNTSSTNSSKTNITNATNSSSSIGNWTISFPSTTTFIHMNSNLSNISSETCYLTWNSLSIYCNGNKVQAMNMARTDEVMYEYTDIPMASQIKQGLDHMNRRAMIYGYMNIKVNFLKFKFFLLFFIGKK